MVVAKTGTRPQGELEALGYGTSKGIFDEKAHMMLQSMSVLELARQLGVSRGVVERAIAR